MERRRCFSEVAMLAVIGLLLLAPASSAQPKAYWSADTPITVADCPDWTTEQQQLGHSEITVPPEDSATLMNMMVVVNFESNKRAIVDDGAGSRWRQGLELYLVDPDGHWIQLTYAFETIFSFYCDSSTQTYKNCFFHSDAYYDPDMNMLGLGDGPQFGPFMSFYNIISVGTTEGMWLLVIVQERIDSDCSFEDCDGSMTLKSWGLVFNPGEYQENTTESTLAVPWFVDNAGVAVGNPPSDGKMSTIIFLHNNLPATFLGFAEYYTENGVYIGPFDRSAFVVGGNATVAFRPVADDPSSVPRGQEAPAGRAVPNRPVNTENGNDGKANGSLVIRWWGQPGDLQGIAKSFMVNGFESSTLLPAGVPVN